MKYDWTDECFLSQKGASKDFKAEWGWTRYLIHEKMFGAVCYDNGDRTSPFTLLLSASQTSRILTNPIQRHNSRILYEQGALDSIKVNGDVPNELVRELIIKSYLLVLKGFSKRRKQK